MQPHRTDAKLESSGSVILEHESFLIEGGVPLESLSEVLRLWSGDPEVGAHSLFLGQVRADRHPEGEVTAIEFSAHRHMAERALRALIPRVAAEHTVEAVRVYLQHGLGLIPVGGIAVIVAVASGHRAEAFAICRGILEALKNEVPIYGRELLGGDDYRWKVNT